MCGTIYHPAQPRRVVPLHSKYNTDHTSGIYLQHLLHRGELSIRNVHMARSEEQATSGQARESWFPPLLCKFHGERVM